MTAAVTEVARTYYEILGAGPERFDPEALRAILAPDLDFEGPIAGHRVGIEPFLAGAARFARATRHIELLGLLGTGARAAALYDAELPGGAVRFAEFIKVHQGRICSLRLLYDATEYRSRVGA